MSFAISADLCAGPYTGPGIAGYLDSRNLPASPAADPNAVVNPIFRGWATGCCDYLPADTAWSGPWNNPAKAIGPPSGNNFDIVSLGELDPNEIAANAPPGSITLTFLPHSDPNTPTGTDTAIRNGRGYDFVVFENGFSSLFTTPAGSVCGKMLAELAYVEVSSDGLNFARFPSISLSENSVGPYGTIEISDVHNLAGKHPNAYGMCTGTPFDLADLEDHPLVLPGIVDLDNINYIRIVDIPGSGDFYDCADLFPDPLTYPDWKNYSEPHPIYDAWPTWGSGGFDLDAIGVLHEQQYSADINLDGIVDMQDFSLFAAAWQSRLGWSTWSARCDLSVPKDMIVDMSDLIVFTDQWLSTELWRKNRVSEK